MVRRPVLCAVLLWLWAGGVVLVPPAAAQTAPAAEEAPLFRVFLKDGSSLVSYGELAQVEDRVVFSMPTSPSPDAPQLQLINIAADSVDWARTNEYAEGMRARRYLATRAAADYALLTNEIAQALNDIGSTDDPARRLLIVERARKALADWCDRSDDTSCGVVGPSFSTSGPSRKASSASASSPSSGYDAWPTLIVTPEPTGSTACAAASRNCSILASERSNP